MCGFRALHGHQPGSLGVMGSRTQATGISSVSSPAPSAAAGHSVAAVPRAPAAGQPWSCARAGSTAPSRVLSVTCPQQPGAWPLVPGREVSPRFVCQFSTPVPQGLAGVHLSHPQVRLCSFMAVTFPEERGCPRSCGFLGMDLLVFESFIV